MYQRLLTISNASFFLFGPRGTGKTTWLKQQLPDAKWYDLLRHKEYLRLTRDIDTFRKEVEALPKDSWVVVDEVQKLPALLDEIHSIMGDYGRSYRFAISGSSARKLKRLGTNLLAGRAINKYAFPLTAQELEFNWNDDDLLLYGCLPEVRARLDDAVSILEAYVVNYIREEIQQEALVKDIDSFSRFLEVAAIMNGQVTNVAGIARDAGVARPTVQRYFDVLVDTMIGVWIPAWRPHAKVKELVSPKFYFFDPGVVRGITGRLRDPLDSSELGPLLETIICHELRAYMHYSDKGGTLSYWSTPSESEVDFIWTRGNRRVGIEVKSSASWRREYGKTLKMLLADGVIESGFVVYRGPNAIKEGPVTGLPLREFLKVLAAGEVI